MGKKQERRDENHPKDDPHGSETLPGGGFGTSGFEASQSQPGDRSELRLCDLPAPVIATQAAVSDRRFAELPRLVGSRQERPMRGRIVPSEQHLLPQGFQDGIGSCTRQWLLASHTLHSADSRCRLEMPLTEGQLATQLSGRLTRAGFVGVVLDAAEALPQHRQLAWRFGGEDLAQQSDGSRSFRLVEMFE